MASLMPNGRQQYFSPSTGAPLAGGYLYTYAAGTSTPKDTWSDASGQSKNQNPVPLDANGSALIFWSGNYKVVLCDSLYNVIFTVDNYSTNSNDHPVQVETQTATAGQTVFTLAAATYTPGINSLHVYVDGLRVFMPDYAETSSTVVTFANGLAAGQMVLFECGSAANSQSSLDASIVTYTPPGGGAASNVQAALADVQSALQLADYTALRSYSGSRTSVYVTGYLASASPSGIAGLFVRDDHDTTTADNGGTVIVTSAGVRWRRIHGESINAKWFGMLLDGSTDDTAALQSAITYTTGSLSRARKLVIPYGVSGIAKITGTLNIAIGGVTIEWENPNIMLKKYFNGDVFMVSAGLVKFINPGIDGNGAAGYTGGGIRFADATHYTFDCVIDNPRIQNTVDSCIIFNGPRGGSGIRVTGGSLTPYQSSGTSSSGYPGIRMSGGADTDATPRIFTDIESSSCPLIDVTGMVTTFIKGGQCATILFGGNPDVNFTAAGSTFISAKCSVIGVRVRDGLTIHGQDHAFAGCITHNYAPTFSSYGVVSGQRGYGWYFDTDSQNCHADASNVTINKAYDAATGLGDLVNRFFAVDMGFNVGWTGSTTNPAIGNGSITGTYNVNGAMVDVSIFIQMGSTTTFGSGYWVFTLPYQISSATFRGTGNARSHNAGVADELGMVLQNSIGSPSNVTVARLSDGVNFSPTVPHTWKSTDYLEINFRYLRG